MKATTSPDEIKQNMQAVGERIKQAFDRVTIPVQKCRTITVGMERPGIYFDWVSFDDFMEEELRWHTMESLESTKTFKDLSGLWQTMKQVKDGLSNDLQLMYNLVDQFSLAQAAKMKVSEGVPMDVGDSFVLPLPKKLELVPPPDAPRMPMANGVASGEDVEVKPKKVKGKAVKLVDDEEEEAEEDDEGEEEE